MTAQIPSEAALREAIAHARKLQQTETALSLALALEKLRVGW